MGRRGPRPTPTQVLRLRGSWRAKVRADEPEPDAAIPAPPDWLSGDGREEWDRLVPLLASLGLLTEMDRSTLALYCQAYGVYVEAQRTLEQEGYYLASEYGQVAHPAVAVAAKAWDQCLRASQRFGFSPSDRAGLVKPKKDADSGKSRFFKAS